MQNRFLNSEKPHWAHKVTAFNLGPVETSNARQQAGYHVCLPVEVTSVYKGKLRPGIALSLSGTKVTISDSVGKGGKNKSEDVLAVQARLEELGFGNISVGGNKLEKMIAFFQAIIQGAYSLGAAKTDAQVEVAANTLNWLNASNAPVWTPLDKGSKTIADGYGYYNSDMDDTDGEFYYGTDWMVSIIKCAGKNYDADYLKTHPSASVMYINDLSLKSGVLKDHAEHQTGLSVDIRLPRTDGKSGGIEYSDKKLYDKDAARAIIQAFRKCTGLNGVPIAKVLFNDKDLIKEGICVSSNGHDDHIHIGIKPPALAPDIDITDMLGFLLRSIF